MRRRSTMAIAVMGVVLSLAPSLALGQQNGSVDFFYVDPFTGMVQLDMCQGDAIFAPPLTTVFSVEMWVRLNGASAGGISGVEGYIDGVETSTWEGFFDRVGNTVSVGDFTEPHDNDGDGVPETRRGNVAFQGVRGPSPEDGCQNGNGTMVKIGSLLMSQSPATNPIPNDHWLRFVPGDPVSVPGLTCALVTLCDHPAFTAVCVAGGSFLINPANQSCLVGVETQNWSAIKSLYR